MSVQTILHISINTLAEEALKGTIANANKFLLHKRFKLGEGYCEEEEFRNSMINEMMQINNCDLISHINNIIENGVETCDEEKEVEPTICQKPISCPKPIEEDVPVCEEPIANAGKDFTHLMNNVGSGTNSGNINGSLSEHNANEFVSILWEVIDGPNGLENGSGSYIYIPNPNQLNTTIQVTNNPVARGQWKIRLTVTNDCGKTASDVIIVTLIQNS